MSSCPNGRTRCGVCNLGGGQKQRARALASEPVPPLMDPEWERYEEERTSDYDAYDDTVYMPDWALDMLVDPPPPLTVPLIEGARFP